MVYISNLENSVRHRTMPYLAILIKWSASVPKFNGPFFSPCCIVSLRLFMLTAVLKMIYFPNCILSADRNKAETNENVAGGKLAFQICSISSRGILCLFTHSTKEMHAILWLFLMASSVPSRVKDSSCGACAWAESSGCKHCNDILQTLRTTENQ